MAAIDNWVIDAWNSELLYTITIHPYKKNDYTP